MKDINFHAEFYDVHIAHTPFSEQASKSGVCDKCRRETVVQFANITAGELHYPAGRSFAEKLRARAQMRFGEMGMIKTDDRNVQHSTRGHRVPTERKGIAGFDDVRTFAAQNFAHCPKID